MPMLTIPFVPQLSQRPLLLSPPPPTPRLASFSFRMLHPCTFCSDCSSQAPTSTLPHQQYPGPGFAPQPGGGGCLSRPVTASRLIKEGPGRVSYGAPDPAFCAVGR